MEVIDRNGIIWRNVVGYGEAFSNLYFVSEMGDIKSANKWKTKKSFVNNSGYKIMRLHNRNNSINILIHRAVAFAFLKNENDLPYVNHKNSERLDNRACNLEWCTSSENLLHSYESRRRSGKKWKIFRAEENHFAKISNKQAIYIFKSRLPRKDLASKFNVTTTVVNHIKTGRTWSSVTGLTYEKWKTYQCTKKST